MGWIQPDGLAHSTTTACSGPSQQSRAPALVRPTSHWAGPWGWWPWREGAPGELHQNKAHPPGKVDWAVAPRNEMAAGEQSSLATEGVLARNWWRACRESFGMGPMWWGLDEERVTKENGRRDSIGHLLTEKGIRQRRWWASGGAPVEQWRWQWLCELSQSTAAPWDLHMRMGRHEDGEAWGRWSPVTWPE
jgi:hypothetical protein